MYNPATRCKQQSRVLIEFSVIVLIVLIEYMDRSCRVQGWYYQEVVMFSRFTDVYIIFLELDQSTVVGI